MKTVTSAGLGNQAFTYDPNGNRKTHVQGGNTAYTIANTNNRLTALAGSANRNYTYTPTGHVQTITGFGGGGDTIFRNGFQIEQPPVTTYGYDPFDRLTSVTGPGINASYKLGADGTRFQKTANGETTRFVYGPGGMLLSERRHSPARWTNYLWLNGEPVGLVRDNTLYYIQTDHLGRPEVITDQAKQRAWRATLKAFDRTVITDHIGGFHLGFPGQYHDTETGHAHNINRDYMPDRGRYLQSDPIGLAGGVNTYGYGLNNPVSVIDPLGLQGFFIPSPGGSMPYDSYRGASSDAAAHGMNMCLGACAHMNTYLGTMIEGARDLMLGIGAERLTNVSSAAFRRACAAGALGTAICTGKFSELDESVRHRDILDRIKQESEYAGQCKIDSQRQFPF